jgi:SAM-dependent methyltransferase
VSATSKTIRRATSRPRADVGYDAPRAYADLIEPRYAPIADALVETARPRPEQNALELGAGTGLVTRRIAGRLCSLLATDLSPAMLEVARSSIDNDNVAFALVDYAKPLPFLDASFDLVLSGLTYVQDSSAALREVARVLRPHGRLALAMWGPRYHEFRLLSDAVTSIGRPPLPSPAPGRAVRRLKLAGFKRVTRREFDLMNDFESVEDYIAYRRGFGVPPGATGELYRRYLAAIERRARIDASKEGTFRLGWRLTVITGTRDAD